MEIDLASIDLHRREENLVSTSAAASTSAPALSAADRNGPNGLIYTIKNIHQPFANSRVRPPLFTSVSFNATAEYAGAVDEKGSVYLFHFLSDGSENLGISLACELQSKGHCLRFNPQRPSEFLVSTQDKQVVCFNRVQGVNEQTATLHGHKRIVHSICFHPALNIVATASLERLIVWDTTSWTRLKCLGGGTGITHAAYAPKGDLILVSFKDNYSSARTQPELIGCAIIGWGAQSFKLLVKLRTDPTGVCLRAFAVSPDSKMVVGAADGAVLVWELHAQRLLRKVHLFATVQRVLQVEFVGGTDAAKVAVLGDDGVIRVVDEVAGRSVVEQEFMLDSRAFLSFAVAPPEGRLWMCSVSNGELNVLDMRSAQRYRRRIMATRRQMGLVKDDAADLVALESHEPTSEAIAACATCNKRNTPADSKQTSPKLLETENARARAAPAIPVVGSVEVLPQEMRKSLGGESEELMEAAPVLEQVREGVDAEGENVDQREVRRRSRIREKVRRPAVVANPAVTQQTRSAAPVQMDLKRVLKLLKDYGEFPERYRLLIWGILLRLPKNEEAFNTIVAYGTHASCVDLYRKFPVKSQREFGYLEKVVSALAHWCPVLSEADFVACLVFPFVKVFGRDELGSFEVCASLILHWCFSWFENFPHPPMRLMTAVESILERECPKLLQHLTSCSVSAETYAWSLLQSAFSEVLSKAEWLKLWDNIFGNFQHPGFLLAVVAAYTVYFRTTLLTIQRKEDFGRFYHRQNALDLTKLLILAHTFLRKYASLFSDFHPSRAFPIPRGSTYPAFENYPRFSVDARSLERERIAAEEAELAMKKDLAESVKAKGVELEKQDRAWAKEQTRLAELEIQTFEAANKEEVSRAKEAKRVNALIRQRKLDNVAKLQNIAEENLKLQQKLRELEHARMKADVERSVEQMKAAIAEKLEDEEVNKVESEAALKLREMHLKHQSAKELQNLRLESRKLSNQFELERAKLFSQMQEEDERLGEERDQQLKELEADSQRKEIESMRLELQNTAIKAQREIEQQKQRLLHERARRSQKERMALDSGQLISPQQTAAGSVAVSRERGQQEETIKDEDLQKPGLSSNVAWSQESEELDDGGGDRSPQSKSSLSASTDLDSTLPLEKKVERLLERQDV